VLRKLSIDQPENLPGLGLTVVATEDEVELVVLRDKPAR
jgi:hypothetical protein